PPPTFRESRHRGLARCRVAVRWRSILMVPERTADGDALSYSLRLLQVRHEQPVRHTLLKVSDHCRLGFGDRDCQRLACGRPELNDIGAVSLWAEDHDPVMTTRVSHTHRQRSL